MMKVQLFPTVHDPMSPWAEDTKDTGQFLTPCQAGQYLTLPTRPVPDPRRNLEPDDLTLDCQRGSRGFQRRSQVTRSSDFAEISVLMLRCDKEMAGPDFHLVGGV